MKPIFIILIIASFSTCQIDQSPTSGLNDQFDKEEVELLKEMFISQKRWSNYEAEMVKLLGLSEIDKLNLKQGDFVYQFKIRKKYDRYWQLIEISDIKSSIESTYRLIRYTIDRDCHPEIGSKAMTQDCLNIIDESRGNIKRAEMDSLNRIMLENEFWELTEQASEIRRYNDLLYHGDSWGILGAFALQFPIDKDRDTTILKTHKVDRMKPSDSKIISQIGNAMLSLAGASAEDNRL